MILSSFMNPLLTLSEEKSMQYVLNNGITPNNETQNAEDASLVKLHAKLCFLMTQFLSHECPKLSQFIVRHLSLMIEHPEVADSTDCRTVYLQLQQHWQNITSSLLEQRKTMLTAHKTIH